MKKIIFIMIIQVIMVYAQNFDKFMDNLKFSNPKGFSAYIQTIGKHKNELNFAKMFKHEKSVEAMFLSQEVKPIILNDSTLILYYENNGTSKIIEYGTDVSYYNNIDGKCEVTSWLPLNKYNHKKAKTITCKQTGKYIETNEEGLPIKTVINGYVMECLEFYTNITRYCKTTLGYDTNNKNDVDTLWLDSLTGKVKLTYTYGLYLRTIDYFENNIPKTYINVNNPNQFLIVSDSTTGEITRIVDYQNGFKYVKILPENENSPTLFLTTDSINYNTENIYILNDDMNIVDSLYNKN